MKRTISTLLAIALMSGSTFVNAGEWGVSAELGYGIAPMPRDGTYWQESMPDPVDGGKGWDSDMGAPYVSLGVEYRTDRFNFIAAYDHLGGRQIWTYGVPDNEYSHLAENGRIPGDSPCNGCRGYFYTREYIEGIRLGITTPTSMKLYGEASLFIMKNDTVMRLTQIPGNTEIKLTTERTPQVRPVVGIGYRFNENAAIVGRYYYLEGDDGLPNMSDGMFTVGFKVSF